MISMTTMLVITVVKSSLALSLGLVGALSIIRFRAAIKEPEELAYLFLAISIGLGFGANQGGLTALVLIIIIAIIIITKKTMFIELEDCNLFLTVMCQKSKDTMLNDILTTLKKHCRGVNIKRLDDSDEMMEATFLVEFDDYKNLISMKNELKNLHKGTKITFLDNKGLA